MHPRPTRLALLSVAGLAACTAAVSCGSDSPAEGDDASCDRCADSAGIDVSLDGIVSDAIEGGTPDTRPACGSTAWPTYGHDGRRTFASDACITGPLTVAWSYAPEPPAGKLAKAVQHVIADKDAVYLQWAATIDPYIGTTAVDRVSTAGARVWTMDTGTDANEGNWASIVGSNVVVNDDGVFFMDAVTGKRGVDTGVDWWGQTIPNGTGLWLANTSKSDGPGLFVGAMDATAKMTWKQNEQGTACGDSFSDTMGGIALDGGVLFYAPSYNTGGGGKTLKFTSGLYAFDAAAGTQKWKIDLPPTSVISVGDGLVYLVESGKDLVARKQSDGSKAWSAPVSGVGAQAPALAGGLAIVGTA
ncbi:MAG: PQQ-binding-like beta-propeller repeat protein, partial [Polyangiales bacterium]